MCAMDVELVKHLYKDAITPTWEIAAYEAVWAKFGTTAKVRDIFDEFNYPRPSALAEKVGIADEEIEGALKALRELLPFYEYSALFYDQRDYPRSLPEAGHTLAVIYYQGALDLLSSRIVSVVGSRKASEDGMKRAKRVARLLVENKFTVMSGLAEGVDTAAHKGALEAGGNTIAVIGTALNEAYPRANYELQELIAREHLLLSQVPFYSRMIKSWNIKRSFFPERNKTMSALSEATVIVEAGETSGTLVQARAALKQGKKLFLLSSCFESGLSWPAKFLEKGAIRVRDFEDILEALGPMQ
jgi:DNA processing protein